MGTTNQFWVLCKGDRGHAHSLLCYAITKTISASQTQSLFKPPTCCDFACNVEFLFNECCFVYYQVIVISARNKHGLTVRSKERKITAVVIQAE
jgi:hypothetical protein